jgi:hypothetical protein
MKGIWMLSARAVFVAALIVTTSCTDTGERVSGPPPDMSPAAAVLDLTGESYELVEGSFPDPLGNGASCDVLGRRDPRPARLRSAAWIGPLGGTITIAGGQVGGKATAHVLIVPPMAVRSRTLFCMRLEPTNHMQVHLQAHALDASGKLVDVGENGFRVPVKLALSYLPANLSATQVRRLVVLYEPENGEPYEPMRSVSLLPLNAVVAELPHFSKYAMAVD